jgi:hypothetical protein
MRRREFIALLGGAAAGWPLAAHAQQSAKLPTIGLLSSSTSATTGQLVTAFVQRLRELGWIEGRTINIEYRWTQGSRERATEIAAEFVRLNVDVIVTAGMARSRRQPRPAGSTSRDIDTAFAALGRDRPDALFVTGGPFLQSRRMQLALLAARHAIPTSYVNEVVGLLLTEFFPDPTHKGATPIQRGLLRARVPRSGGECRGAGLAGVIHIFIPIA